MEICWEEITLKVVDGIATVSAQEIADMAEMSEASGMQQLVVSKGGHVENEYIVIVLAVFGHGMGYDLGNGGSMTHYDAVAVVDVFDGIFGF